MDDRIALEVVDAALEILDQQVCQITAEAVPDQDAHDDQVLPLRRHAVGGDLPAAAANPVGQVEQVEARIGAFLEGPAHRRDTAAAVVDNLEDAELLDFVGEILGRVVAGLVDLAVSFNTQAQEIVILGNDLSAGAGEVQGEGRHVAAQVVDPEDQVVGQVFLVAEDAPADTERGQSELVAGGVDRLDPRQAEIPFQLRLDKGGEEAAAGAVDVDRDIQTGLLLQLVESIVDVLDRFIL